MHWRTTFADCDITLTESSAPTRLGQLKSRQQQSVLCSPWRARAHSSKVWQAPGYLVRASPSLGAIRYPLWSSAGDAIDMFTHPPSTVTHGDHGRVHSLTEFIDIDSVLPFT